MTNYNPNRQPEGIPAGGQFAAATHSEPEISIRAALPYTGTYATGRAVLWTDPNGAGREQTANVVTGTGSEPIRIVLGDGSEQEAWEDDLRVDPERETGAILNRLEAGNQKFSLSFVSYDDHLTEDQTVDYLNGDIAAVDESVFDNFADQNALSTREAVEELLRESGLETHDVSEELLDDLRDAVRDHDDSDPVNDLIRNTPEKLMRLSLDQPTSYEYWQGGADGVEEKREAKIAEILTAGGMDVSTPEAKEAISELVANGPWDWHEGVDLDVVYYDDIRGSTVFNADAGVAESREITFKDPHILLIDRMNGSGHDVQIPGTIKATATPEKPVKLDAAKNDGYGWDDTAGVVHSAYRTETASTWTSPAPEAAAA